MRKSLATIFLILAITLTGVIFLNTQELSETINDLIKNKQVEQIEQSEFEVNKEEIEEQNEPKREPESEQTTKEITDGKQINFQWSYNNRQYELTAVLHESTYNYYNNQPKEYTYTGSRPENWKKEYYNMFLQTAEGDNTFAELSSKLKEIGEQVNLNQNQVVELAVSFVQSIPYDKEKSLEEAFEASYPYEVLYEKKGVCSGKSFLGALLVKELGYGVALFSFEEANHMVIGIKCPEQYDSYNTGYCYTELTTPGWKIGIEDYQDIENITSTSRVPSLDKKPEVYEVADGKTYRGITAIMKDKERIKELNKEINDLEQRIDNLKEDLEYYQKIKDYESYNELVSTYNDLVALNKKKVEKYNNLIDKFSPGE